MSPPVKNIYYMLCYAFKTLKFKDYERVSSEDFEDIYDLFSEVLTMLLNRQIKQGLHRDYIEVDENTSSIRGKINITQSINELSFINKKLNCTYDEFSVNSRLNKIIKTTLILLLKAPISKERKRSLKNILLYFRDVDTLDTNNINWQIRYDRNNQDYRMIIGICYLTLTGLIQSDKKGNKKLKKFLDERKMSKIYEQFVFNYYDLKYKRVLTVDGKEIKWPLNNPEDNKDKLLPNMYPDIVLSSRTERNVLIIDTKYYDEILTESNSHHSHNLYQIFTYVKSKQFELKDYEISGMLLYAGTNEEVPPKKYMMDGNKISAKTLNLNQDFKLIEKELDDIVIDFLKVN